MRYKEEQIQIGGGRSRGLGWCSLIEQSFIHYTDPIAMLVGEGGGTVWNEETQRGYVGSFLELTEANSA